MFITKQLAEQIAKEIKSATGHDINLMDTDGRIFASTDASRIGHLHEGARLVMKNNLDWLTIRAQEELPGSREGINLPIEINGERVGVIGITGAEKEVSSLGLVVKRMTEIMILDIHRQEEQVVRDDAQRCFIENWLFSDAPDAATLVSRGNLLGIDLDAPWTVVILTTPPINPNNGDFLAPEMSNALLLKHIQPFLQREQGSKAVCQIINQRILLLFQGGDSYEVVQKTNLIRRELEYAFQATIHGGVSKSGRRGLEIRQSYQEARTACQVSTMGNGGVLIYDEVSLEFVINCIPHHILRSLSELVFANCSQEERREMGKTIFLYYKYGGNVAKAAESLFLHKNTFHYRLQKIKEKTGYNIRVPKESMLLYLASLYFILEG